MSLAGASSAPMTAATGHRSLAAGVLVPAATVLVIVALALLPLLTPPVMHRMLDTAEAHLWLGVDAVQAHAWSDATVRELVMGGPFAIAGPGGAPLFGPDEVSHLRDARMLLWLLLGSAAGALAALVIHVRRHPDRAVAWQGVARGGAIAALGTVLIGVVGVLAFEPLFELFHRVVFPNGNWAFDASTQRLVQLYPFTFWRLAAAALGVAVVTLGVVGWAMGRVAGRRSVARGAAAHRRDG